MLHVAKIILFIYYEIFAQFYAHNLKIKFFIAKIRIDLYK